MSLTAYERGVLEGLSLALAKINCYASDPDQAQKAIRAKIRELESLD